MAYECFKGIRKNDPKFNAENHNFKALSPVMIMLATAQVLRSFDKDKYVPIAEECLNEMLHGGYNTEKALMENVTQNGGFSDTPTGRIVNPGHSFEAAWFIMSEGVLTENQEAIDMHHASPMMNTIMKLREKYNLHMKVERYISDDEIPETDKKFIKE